MNAREHSPQSMHTYGSCVSWDGNAILLLGETGSGKSDLALRLIERGAKLVSDDWVCITRDGARLVASPPPTIHGLLEVRGLGIVQLEVAGAVPIALAVELTSRENSARLPDASHWQAIDVRIPSVRLPAFEASTAERVLLALKIAIGEIKRIAP